MYSRPLSSANIPELKVTLPFHAPASSWLFACSAESIRKSAIAPADINRRIIIFLRFRSSLERGRGRSAGLNQAEKPAYRRLESHSFYRRLGRARSSPKHPATPDDPRGREPRGALRP